MLPQVTNQFVAGKNRRKGGKKGEAREAMRARAFAQSVQSISLHVCVCVSCGEQLHCQDYDAYGKGYGWDACSC